MTDVLVLDLMGTVLRDPYREALEAATGMPLERAHRFKDPDAWPAFERGELTETEFVDRFFIDSGQTLDVAAFHAARRAGYAYLPGMQSLLTRAASTLPTYIASNYPVWIAELRERFALDAHCVDVIASHELGARKPDPEFFQRLLARIGHPASRCVFVDDREDNCAAAAELGMRTIRFTGAAALEERLRADGLLP